MGTPSEHRNFQGLRAVGKPSSASPVQSASLMPRQAAEPWLRLPCVPTCSTSEFARTSPTWISCRTSSTCTPFAACPKVPIRCTSSRSVTCCASTFTRKLRARRIRVILWRQRSCWPCKAKTKSPESYLLELAGEKMHRQDRQFGNTLNCSHFEDELSGLKPIMGQKICHDANPLAILDSIL